MYPALTPRVAAGHEVQVKGVHAATLGEVRVRSGGQVRVHRIERERRNRGFPAGERENHVRIQSDRFDRDAGISDLGELSAAVPDSKAAGRRAAEGFRGQRQKRSAAGSTHLAQPEPADDGIERLAAELACQRVHVFKFSRYPAPGQ